MAKLKVDIKHVRSNNMELKVRSIISTLHLSEDLAAAKRGFEYDIKKIISGNHIHAHLQYKTKLENGILQIYHEGSKQDRILAEVKEVTHG